MRTPTVSACAGVATSRYGNVTSMWYENGTGGNDVAGNNTNQGKEQC